MADFMELAMCALCLLPGPFWFWQPWACLAVFALLAALAFRARLRGFRRRCCQKGNLPACGTPLAVAVAVAAGVAMVVRFENAADLGNGTPAQRLCVQMLDYDWDDNLNINSGRTLPGRQRAFVHACAEVVEELDGEQLEVIKPLMADPLADEIRLSRQEQPGYVFPEEERMRLRAQVVEEGPRGKLPPGKTIEEFLDACRGTFDEEQEPETVAWLDHVRVMTKMGARFSQEPTVHAAEIPEALRHGRVVRFDATEILPARTFNISPQDLVELHGGAEAARGIQMLAFGPRGWCRFLAWMRRRWLPYLEYVCSPSLTLHDLMTRWGPPWGDLDGARINLRRLPRFVDIEGMVRRLGLEDEVERAEPQLLLAFSEGEVHYDEQDNIFIGVSGLSVIIVSEANYTDAAHGHKDAGGYGQRWVHWVQRDFWPRDHLPFYVVMLRPGEGVTIPSRSYHAVLASQQRIAFNIFLEPKFRKMAWPSHPRSYWVRERAERVALRSLLVKACGRLWEKQGYGFLAQAGALEFL